jgi:hypothetical protein
MKREFVVAQCTDRLAVFGDVGDHEDLGDRPVRLFAHMGHGTPEVRSEPNLRGFIDCLIAKDEDSVIQQCALNSCDDIVSQRVTQINTAHIGSESLIGWSDLYRTPIVHAVFISFKKTNPPTFDIVIVTTSLLKNSFPR